MFLHHTFKSKCINTGSSSTKRYRIQIGWLQPHRCMAAVVKIEPSVCIQQFDSPRFPSSRPRCLSSPWKPTAQSCNGGGQGGEVWGWYWSVLVHCAELVRFGSRSRAGPFWLTEPIIKIKKGWIIIYFYQHILLLLTEFHLYWENWYFAELC